LRFECLGIREVDDAGGNGGNLRDLRGAKTPRPGDDLKASNNDENDNNEYP
jgi:hypothetical protein